MSVSNGTNTFLILLEDGERNLKLRIKPADLLSSSNPLSGKDLVSTILAHNDVARGGIGVDVYNPRTEKFVALHEQEDIASDLGTTRLRCFLIRNQQEAPVLAINGRFFEYDNGMVVANTRLVVDETPNIPGAGTGLNVWDGAVLLARYLEHNPHLIRKKCALELGAGCGLVGIVASLLGAERVIITDLPYTIELMAANVAANQPLLGTVDCRVCDWMKPPIIVDESWRCDVLLVADCVWIEELVPPLLATIQHFIESSTDSVHVIVSYQQRGKTAHDLFWTGMRNMFDTIEMAHIAIAKPNHLNVYDCTNMSRKAENNSKRKDKPES